ncbi:hypothetical protein [Roseivirga sp.]|uniref:hypothetical protein n=1 Tax=Roseivirga sp. TaxID=1964215 RepID=UPI002B267EBD|nr:hypothetical protein [Roseivirga sp.]
MRYFVFFLLIILSHLSLAQDRAKVDFEKDVRSVKTTLDGKKLIIKSKKWSNTALGSSWRDYLIYDFESKSINFFSRTGPYGGFSPNANYFIETELSYVDRKRGPYEVTLLNMASNEKQSWKNENFGLAVYDNGKVLASNAKTYKGGASVDSFSTLYIYDPQTKGKREVVGKKELLEKELYSKDHGIDAEQKFFHLMSPDNLSSWGGELYSKYYTEFLNYYDFRDGSKQAFNIRFADDTTSSPERLVLMVDGKSAMMRVTSRRNDDQWQDYFIRADSDKKLAMSNHITHKTPVHYQMQDNIIYQFDNEDGVIMRFNTSSGLPVSDKLFFPKIPKAMLNGEEYRFTIASEKYLVATPTKRTGEVADVIIYDLENNAVVDNFALYQKDKPKETTSSYSTKTLYKSDLLNSYDRLSLPYTLGDPSGRQVTGLSGASSIGGGEVFAIGMIGVAAGASDAPILLSLTRYKASNGSEVSTYYVSVFDKDGNYKTSKEIGSVQQSNTGRTYAAVNFKIQREAYNTFTIIGEQQFEQRKTPFKITIEPSGNIH